MKTFAQVKNGVVRNVFTATQQWANDVYGNQAVEVTENGVGIGSLWDGTSFSPAPRQINKEARATKQEIRRLFLATMWTADPDAELTNPQKTAWAAWRKSLRQALKTLSNAELADFVIPEPPFSIDED